jgi:hypothetical protein
MADEHVLFVWTPTGYRLESREGQAPAAGEEVELDGRRQLVVKVGPSPLPGDGRPCAFLSG